MWDNIKPAFDQSQFFNTLAIGFLTECVLLVPLAVCGVVTFPEVLQFVERPAGAILALLASIALARLVASFVGLVVPAAVRPVWPETPFGWYERVSARLQWALRWTGWSYRKLFFGTSARCTERSTVIDQALFREGDTFCIWARGRIKATLDLDVDTLSASAGKDDLHWVLYLAGEQRNNAKPVRDDVGAFDLTANFQARLAIVLHLAFWIQIGLAVSYSYGWPLLAALGLVLVTRLLGAGVADFLLTKHRLAVLRFLAVAEAPVKLVGPASFG